MVFRVQFRTHGRWATIETFADLIDAKRYFERRKTETPREFLRLADKGGELAIYSPQSHKQGA